MGKPVNTQSVTDQTGTATGDSVRLRGHHHLALFVAADNYDDANDTLEVALEVSPDGQNWEPVTTVTGTGYDNVFGAPAEHIRARVTSFTDNAGGDLQANAWVLAGGWEGPGVRGGRES